MAGQAKDLAMVRALTWALCDELADSCSCRLITLNQMNASAEITEEQSRQLLFDMDAAYQEFFSSLRG
jgi:hypothetical protein